MESRITLNGGPAGRVAKQKTWIFHGLASCTEGGLACCTIGRTSGLHI